MKRILRPALAAALATWSAAASQAATFKSQPIEIYGSLAVAALAINDAGTIVGTFAENGDEYEGFIQQGSTLTVLANDMPTAINHGGAVTGIGPGDMGFLWQKGAIVPGVSFPLGVFGNTHLTPVLNRAGKIAYATSHGNVETAYAGRHGHFHALRGVSPTTAVVTSINDQGIVSGFERATIDGQQQDVIFFGQDGEFGILPNTTDGNLSGGFVNDAGQVAYSDGSHGYVYAIATGQTATFTLPASYGFEVQAINKSGRVVGIYSDSSVTPNVKHAFLYNGTAVTAFRAYNNNDTVQVALNDRGVIVVSDSANGVPGKSTLVRCSGSGC